MTRVVRDDPRDPHGAALWDYFCGDVEATLGVHGDLGEYDEMPAAVFFREPADFFPFERVAIDHCQGRVLDLGAGAGVHALALQARGLKVTAIDIVPLAAEVMRRRGVFDVRTADLIRGVDWEDEVEPGTFDTLLMLMNGTGITGTLAGLESFLARAHRILAPGGQILVDSGDLRPEEEKDGPPRLPLREDGRYFGEAQIQLEYRGVRGQPFEELYVDPTTLTAVAADAGWRSEILFQDDGASYLARLTRENITP